MQEPPSPAELKIHVLWQTGIAIDAGTNACRLSGMQHISMCGRG